MTQRAAKPYRKIDKAQLKAWKDELSVRTKPAVFKSRADEIRQSIGPRTFFTQGGLQFLRDAWTAAQVATALSAETVRLWKDNRPDFEVVIDGEPRLFEVTEADLPGRRRGEEYQTEDETLEDDPESEWRRRFEAIPSALQAVISKKIGKGYAPDVSLVVLLNLGCYGVYLDEGIPAIQKETLPAKDVFREVFVYWEGILFSCWKDGQPNAQQWTTNDGLLTENSPEAERMIWEHVFGERE